MLKTLYIHIYSRIRGFVGQNPCGNNSPTGSLMIAKPYYCLTVVRHLSDICICGCPTCVRHGFGAICPKQLCFFQTIYDDCRRKEHARHTAYQSTADMFFVNYSVNSLRYAISPARLIRDSNSRVNHSPGLLESPVFGT